MRRTLFRSAALLLALGLVAAACGDDDDDDGGSTATTGGSTETSAAAADTTTTAAETTDSTPATGDASGDDIRVIVASDPLHGAEASGLTRGVTDTTVTFGCVIQASAFAGAEDGYRARFERANREGGVNGRQIEMQPCEDDAIDAAQNLQIIRRQVDQDQVFGMMTTTAQVGQASADYMGENEVPYTGWGFIPPFCGQRWGFGLNGCIAGAPPEDTVPHAVNQSNLIDAILDASGIAPEDARIANQGGDDEAGHLGVDGFVQLAEIKDVEMVYAEANMPTSGVTDFTPFVQAVLATDPNIVVEYVNFESVGGFAAGLRAAGYDGVILNFVAYIPGLLQASPQFAEAIEGSYISTQIVPQEEQTPYIIQLEDDLEASGAENGRFMTFGAALAYNQADVMVALLEAAGPDLNTTTFDAAANGGGFHYEALEGGPGSMDFPENHFLPTDSAAIVQVVDAAFQVVSEFQCYESVRIR